MNSEFDTIYIDDNSVDGEKTRDLVERLRRLERVRRDFVANVSHELKTPITAIKGFVEALKDGAIENPKDARRFIEIISKHASRLNAIIEDLLNLSRIEQQAEIKGIALCLMPLRSVIESATLTCMNKSPKKNINIKIDCDSSVEAYINPTLFEQAVTNLIDNAIKYSGEDKEIRIKTERKNDEILTHVIDSGVGIPKKYLSRIFERFYRIDKARSRALGGTGLGLSIVRHIINAHDGHISVESEVGKGSKFTIHLPG